jgi:hypothetical protein
VAEAPAKKRRNLDADAPSNLEDSPPYGEKSFNIKRMPIFPTGVNHRLQGTSNSYRSDLWDTRCCIQSVAGSRPPIRTGRIDRASPVLSSVSISAAHNVPSPSAGVRRSPGIFLMKRSTAPSFFMPITES